MNPQTETTLRFTGDHPVAAVWAAALGLALLMWLLYRREARLHAGRWAWLPGLLRSAAVFILVLALSGPVLRHETTRRQLGRVIFAVDSSASMKLEDETDGAVESGAARQNATRHARAERLLLGGAVPLLKKITESQDAELVLLRGQQAQRLWWHRLGGKDTPGPMPAAFDLPSDAPLTSLDTALREALGTPAPGTALVVLTDGQHNAPGSPEEFAGAMKEAGIPVFTIGFGVETPPPDLSVLNVITPESVFAQENLQGRVILGDSLPPGTPCNLRVVSAGRVLWERNFSAEGKGERRFDFSFPVKDLPPAPATELDKTLRLLTVQTAVAGERSSIEKTRSNNSREVALHLLERKRRALILDGRPRWETRYLHNHFDRDERWQVSMLLDDPGEAAAAAPLLKDFPRTREDLFQHDLVILGDAAPSRFSAPQLDWLVEFVEKRGGGLILVDGARGHLRAWAAGKTAPLVPVQWLAGGGERAPLRWQLTPEGENQAALRLSDSASANSSLWPALPEMTWAARVSAQPGALTLAALRQGAGGAAQPGAVFRQLGAGAVLYLASDDLWRWRFQVADLYHQRLWMQLAAWIAAPPFQAENDRVSIGADRLRHLPGETAEIRVRLRDADGALISSAQPRAILIHEGREIATLTLEPDPTHYGIYRATTPPLKAGAYEVAVAEGPAAARAEPRLSLRVADTGSTEWASLTMNRPLLEAVASASGGRFLREEQAATDLPNLLQAIDRRQTTVRETNLWSSWWWFGAVICLLTAEWLLRKKLRLV
ncbi:MAG TPA: hypothetical protein DIT64_13995 [Verrucomicrobiales bacterium]|nr:hypothetical protein [Verrucomicrobiales bacterium]